ncbi:MAG: hypothetical protein OHK0039_06650 [Bacteroidia bacterium]
MHNVARDFTDEELIAGIRAQDREALVYVYRVYFPLLRAWISRNRGDAEAARDIFQEAMMVVYDKLSSGEAVIWHSLKAYLMGVCRNLWLMHLRKRGYSDLPDDLAGPDLAAAIADDLLRRDRFALYQEHMARLGEACVQVLRWFLAGESLREIARRLDTTEAYAKKRKFTCQKRLIESISSDPRFNELCQ